LRTHGIAAVTEIDTVNIEIDGQASTAWGFRRPVKGSVEPAIVSGRAPKGANEIALGAATLNGLGKSIGDSVRAQGPRGAGRYRVVGRAVFPRLDSPQAIASGAVFSGAGLDRVLDPHDPENGSPYLVIRAVPGANLTELERRINAIPNLDRPFGPSVPLEANRIQEVNWLTAAIAALLAVLALLAVGHALVTSVRRSRHQLAILKTLGFDRAQVRGAVAWQASTLGVVGMVVGIPAGLVVGSVAWRLVADGLGVSTTATVPLLAVVATAAGALLAVNLLAFLPARSAAGTRPAVALHAE
jgi:hypothetical protein